ncbi:hypothetical protein E4U13_005335 [Claviceps humidiphila]|uniref:3-hydroxyisobutyrate dehydrogenase n=1 Tax=Claviceps humidiphila TaxID=1294629 RepID=A0A9P7Q743_9HYPO|nr:hypothetical protein E4U13_005335 [Claviceps humidiphila]
MAQNLRSKLQPTDSLSLFDANPHVMKKLETDMSAATGKGPKMELADSASAATQDADTVVTVLPSPQHVQTVYDDILTHSSSSSYPSSSSSSSPSPETQPQPRLFIDCSTIDPSTSRRVAQRISSSHQGHFVDAPMSGGVVGASAGSLTFMLGSPPEMVPRVQPTLLRMGAHVLHCGDQGAGLAAKLANNYLLALSNIATAEAMNLGIRWGLDPRTLARVINLSTGRCWPSEVNNPVPGVVSAAPASRDYEGGFALSLMSKDLRLAVMAAREAGAVMPLAGPALGVYEAAGGLEECKGRDFSVVYRYLTEGASDTTPEEDKT